MENNNLIIIIITFIVGYIVSNNSMCRLIEGSGETDLDKRIQDDWDKASCKYVADYTKDAGAFDRGNSNCQEFDCSTGDSIQKSNGLWYRYGHCANHSNFWDDNCSIM